MHAQLVQIISLVSLLIRIAYGDPDLTTQPSWEVTLQQVDETGTSVRLEINNTNDKPLNILKWNSILEEFPVSYLPFFLYSGSQDDVTSPVDQAPRAHANYVRAFASHFIQIQPNQKHTHDIDLRKWFAIPRRGPYKIRWLKDELRGFLGEGPLAPEPLQRHEVYKLPRMEVTREVSVVLEASVAPLEVEPTAMCESARDVSDWKDKAIRLANDPDYRRDESEKEWRQFFNGDRRVKDLVSIVFSTIHNYRLPRGGNDHIVRERCATAPSNTDNTPPCKTGVISYHETQPGKDIIVVFCPDFFNAALLPAIEDPCRIPSEDDPDIIDRSGVYLNAFLWSEIQNEFKIRDGLLNTCYGFFCATTAANTRRESRLESTPLRTPRPGPAFEEGIPEIIATNYLQYAYAARAKGCIVNEPTYCSEQECSKLGHRAWTALRNNMKTILIGAITSAVGACASYGVTQATT